jgi:hypothetical protein
MLRDYDKQIVRQELAKPDYDGLTAQQAWDWLYVPRVQQVPRPPPPLTLIHIAAALGPAKAEAVAAALLSAYPRIGPYLIQTGVDAADPHTQEFFSALVAGAVVTADEAAALLATASDAVEQPPRAAERFTSADWPHVDAGGNLTDDAAAKPIDGFPNGVDFADFSPLFAEVRGG